MKEVLQIHLEGSTTLEEAEQAFFEFVVELKEQTDTTRLDYIAGIISSDGEEHINRNIGRLSRQTERKRIRSKVDYPVFSTVDVFGGLFHQLAEMKLEVKEREAKFKSSWRNVLTSGFITDILMTPRWQKSSGSSDEHEVAKKEGIRIHYV